MSIAPRRRRWKSVLLVLLMALALGVVGAITQRGTLLTWYYAYRLELAPEPMRQAWVDKLVDLGEPALPRLIGLLQKDNANLCESARSGLENDPVGHVGGRRRHKSGISADAQGCGCPQDEGCFPGNTKRVRAVASRLVCD